MPIPGFQTWPVWVTALGLIGALLAAPASVPAQQDTPPRFESSETGQRTVDENTPAGTALGEPVAAVDDDTAQLQYTLTGDDAAVFGIDPTTGQLRTAGALNYEKRVHYSVTVTASDATSEASIAVTVEVLNVDEPGRAWLRPTQPRVGQVIRLLVDDPDGGVTVISPVWEQSSDNGGTWTPFSYSRNASSWIPPGYRQGDLVRVTVTYRDRHGEGKKIVTAAVGPISAAATQPELVVEHFVSGLSIPWDAAFTGDGALLFTERAGALRVRLADGTVSDIAADLSDLYVERNAGLMAILVDPSFATNRRFYTCQTHNDPREAQIVAWTVDDSYSTATRTADPLVGGITTNHEHSGCRLRFGPQGYLWATTGDAAIGTAAQDLDSLAGKVLRFDAASGAAAAGNPFDGSLIYSYGHRNPQGLALRPGTGQMWAVGHGPRADDEVNLLESGANYGWDPSYHPSTGYYYNERSPMTAFEKFPDALPAKWASGSTTIAPSGAVFLTGGHWGDWEGRLAVAMLEGSAVHLLEFDTAGGLLSETVPAELDGTRGRLRSPLMGTDDALYITTSNGSRADRILRVTPQQAPMFESAVLTPVEIPVNALAGTTVVVAAADDFNNEPLTYRLADDHGGVFAVAGAAVVVAGTLELAREYPLTLIVADPGGLTDTTSVAVTAGPADDTIVVLPDLLVSFHSRRYTVTEGLTVEITVTLDQPPGRRVEVPVTAAGLGGASAGDWSGAPTTVVFAQDETTAVFDLSTVDGGEQVLLGFGDLPDGVSAGSPAQATITVIDNDTSGRKPIFGSRGGPAAPEPEPEVEPDPETLAAAAAEDFEDVDPGDYFAAAAGWMLAHGITAGCAPGMFCPSSPVTRQQFVTFLWRAAGSLDPAEAGSAVFGDVAEHSYADAAIGWAFENRVTAGCKTASPDEQAMFCPAAPVSRAQAATLLYGYVRAEPSGRAGVFNDVDPDSYYAAPVGWMTAHQITVGCTETEFCPHRTATRAHAAAFLYRVAQRPDSWGAASTGILRRAPSQ